MIWIHKVANRRPSRDEMTGPAFEPADTQSQKMDYNYPYSPMPDYRPKKPDKRRSRSKSGFFGGRASLEDEALEQRTETRGSIIDKDTLMSFGKRGKLRKTASKSSFQPVTEEECTEPVPKSPLLRRMPDSWRGRHRTSSPTSATFSAREGRISQPFNFFHISHANRNDISEMNIPREWIQVTSPPPQKQLGTQKKHSSYGLRSKLLGRHQSQTHAEFKPPSCPSEESFTTCTSIPASPPPWSPSSQPTHSSSVEYVCHAITTPGVSAYGEKSAGIARVSKDALDVVDPSPSSPVKERSCTPDAPIPEVRETLATPEQIELRASRRRTKRISVRVRPISQFSDFNADFIVPGSPLLVPRLSRRFSAQAQKFQPELELGDFVLEESWEEDIDYSYDHAAESHCDFEWEKSSTYAVSTYGGDNDELDSQQIPQPSPYLAVPEKGECPERRITGQFEAHLLLPGSAGSDTASTTKRNSVRNSVCENATGIIFRAARSSLSQRATDSTTWSSARSSASISKMLSRNHRDELARVAEHLEDHIAFLNAEISVNNSRDSLKPPSISTVCRKSLTRSRTDSDATCVTLCSDAETITPTDSSELVTPPNSNHNSFTLHKQYDEERMAKGLSFPASTIPGVIEFSPEIHDLSVPGDETIPFI